MKTIKFLSLLSIFFLMYSLPANAQKKTLRQDLNIVVSVPCSGEILSGTISINSVDQGFLTNSLSKYSTFHSGVLTSQTGSNVYRLAGCSEEKVTDGNDVISYYGVWHFVGKKGNVIRVIVTTQPGDVEGYFSDITVNLAGECEE